MKLNLTFLLMTFFIISMQLFGQSEIIHQVKEVIKTGNAKELAKHLNSSVDITLDGNMQSYNKAQAEFVLRDYFKQFPPSEVNIIHQGSSKGGQPFAILQYKSSSDMFRLFIKVKTVNNNQVLDDIRFTKWE
jgi:hypothetical protein